MCDRVKLSSTPTTRVPCWVLAGSPRRFNCVDFHATTSVTSLMGLSPSVVPKTCHRWVFVCDLCARCVVLVVGCVALEVGRTTNAACCVACVQYTYDAPVTLFITRERQEHANFFHAMTDFVNAYQALHMVGVIDARREGYVVARFF